MNWYATQTKRLKYGEGNAFDLRKRVYAKAVLLILACNFLLFLHFCADEFHDDAIRCLVF